MSNKKKLQDLTIRDNFMFAAVMMQVEKDNLGKRTRYYHSHMDMELLESGAEYDVLPSSYVIFVCDFDPFGREKYCYTFENRCLEDLELGLEDGSRSIFLSTKGKNGNEIPKELRAFLEFVGKDTSSNDMKIEDSYVKQLQKSIRSIKESREMEHRFQGAWAVSEFRRGKAEGKAEGKLEALRDSVIEFLDELQGDSVLIRERILAEESVDVLKKMLKVAAKSDSIEQFRENISNL